MTYQNSFDKNKQIINDMIISKEDKTILFHYEKYKLIDSPCRFCDIDSKCLSNSIGFNCGELIEKLIEKDTYNYCFKKIKNN